MVSVPLRDTDTGTVAPLCCNNAFLNCIKVDAGWPFTATITSLAIIPACAAGLSLVTPFTTAGNGTVNSTLLLLSTNCSTKLTGRVNVVSFPFRVTVTLCAYSIFGIRSL
ncbi:hypothetical protein D9M68_720990 [compost metagenome]